MATAPLEMTSSIWDCCIEKTFYEDEIEISRFECTICSSSVSRRADFPRHMRQHTREGLVPCLHPGCKHPAFTQFGNMMTHYLGQHKGIRYRCPELVVNKNGHEEQCPCDYSDRSGLIRHMKDKHGWRSSRSKTTAKAKEPAIKREADDSDDLTNISAPSSKRAKPTPSPSSSRRSPKKPTSRKSAPVQVQQIDWSPTSTIPTAGPSVARPFTASGSCFGFGCPTTDRPHMQSQPAASMALADPLAHFPSATPAQPGNSGDLFNPEPQMAAVNKWVFPPITDFSFNFIAEPLPPLPLSLPAVNGNSNGDGTIDPSMLMIPAPIAPPTVEQANLAGAGLASPPEFYHPGWGNGSMDSSRESSASPGGSVFDGMPQWLPFPSDPLFNGYYGL